MKSPWRVCRTLSERDDGERRWDYAFQFLLRWVQEEVSNDGAASQLREERQDEHCPLHTGVDRSTAATAND